MAEEPKAPTRAKQTPAVATVPVAVPKGCTELPALARVPGLSPLVRLVEYYDDGSIKRVEYDWLGWSAQDNLLRLSYLKRIAG